MMYMIVCFLFFFCLPEPGRVATQCTYIIVGDINGGIELKEEKWTLKT